MKPAATPWLPITCPPEQAMGEPPPETAVFLLLASDGTVTTAQRLFFRIGGWTWLPRTTTATDYARVLRPGIET